MDRREKSGLDRFRRLLRPREDQPHTAAYASSGSELRRALSLLEEYERSGKGWFWSTDAEGCVYYISGCVAEVLGCDREALIGAPFSSLFSLDREDDEDAVERTLPLIFSTRKTFTDFTVRAAIDGRDVWWAISGRPQHDAAGQFCGYHGSGADITVARQSQRDASRLAMYDSLTGLSNRHRMARRLDVALTACKAAKRSCAVMLIDLDRFKQVNDTLGHPAGDELLKQVADRLRRVIDKGCEIGRLGGDEFKVILPDIDDRGRLGEIGRKIISILSQPYSIDGSRCVIGASVGIAIAPYDGIASDEIIRGADLALYAAKGGGRGQFRFYSIDLHSEAARRRQIEDDLRDALARDQIWLAYQPIVDTQTNRVVSLEALMRWEHPDLGFVSPAVFIPIAEETGLIRELGNWALRQACQEAAQWPGNVRVSVNVSPAQFTSPDLPAIVTQALAGAGLAADRLELELTESIFVGDDQESERMFAALKALGVRLVLDDFGTGYSSLGYLRSAPFDKIKIDKCFIHGITTPGSRNVAIIKAIVSLAGALDMDTTAEGIEAQDELAMMRDLGVKQVQGYIYSRPCKAADVADAFTRGDWVIAPDGPSRYRAERRTVLRKIGLIHEDHRYDVMMRNLSRTGCMVEGLLEVPVGTQFVVDFGEGQLAVAVVRRSFKANMGMEFELPLVDDGAGGLVTRNRVSPYVLAAAGMPLAALPGGSYPLGPGGTEGPVSFSIPRFAQVNDAIRRDTPRTAHAA